MSETPTREQVLQVIRQKRLVIHECGMCGYPCSYSFEGTQLGYDTGCECTRFAGGWQPCDESDLDFYLDPTNGWTKKLSEFVKP